MAKVSLFKEELEATDEAQGMAFENMASVDGYAANGEIAGGVRGSMAKAKFGKEDDQDSMVSGHSMSRLQKKANLELVW